MNEHHHKYFSVDVAFCNYFVTMQEEPMKSSFTKNKWNWNYADFTDLVLILPEAATEGILLKQVFLKISQYSQENTYAMIYF